jgi:hypothetical protein
MLKKSTEQLVKATKAGRPDRDLKAFEKKLDEHQAVVDEVGNPPAKVCHGSRASKTHSKHHPQARQRWHFEPHNNICEYSMSFPCLLGKDSQNAHYFMHLTTQVLHLRLLCKATRIASILAFLVAMVFAELHSKQWRFGAFRCDGTGITRLLLQWRELCKIAQGLKNITNVFLLTSCLMWTVPEIQEED